MEIFYRNKSAKNKTYINNDVNIANREIREFPLILIGTNHAYYVDTCGLLNKGDITLAKLR